MLNNTDITLFYCRTENKKDVYRKVILRGVHWEDLQQSNVIKSGQKTSDSVMIYIPLVALETADKAYLLPKTYSLAADGETGFTVEANTKNMIVKGSCNFEFDSSSEQKISESKKYLLSNFDNVVTVMVVDSYLYGSRGMQHLEVSCK